jgi:hypothetical protein
MGFVQKTVFSFVIVVLASMLVVPAIALAQTACPAGAVAGSRMCGPDGGSQNLRVVRHDAHGAAVHSAAAGFWYYQTGANSGGLPSVREGAMADCQRDGNDDCNFVGTWTNSCASVATVMVDGEKQALLATGSTARSSKRAVRAACESLAPGAQCKVSKKSQCINFKTDLVPY